MVRLQRQEYGAAYTILERCRQCGEDPYLWRLCLVKELAQLFGSQTAYIGDHKLVGPVGSDGWIVPYALVDFNRGSEKDRTAFWDRERHGRPEQNPMVALLCKLSRSRGRLVLENANGQVDLLDFAKFRQAFGKTLGDAGYLEGLDDENDGAIGLLGFSGFCQNFGT